MIETQGVLEKVQNMLNIESNANVLASILAVLQDIS